MCIHQALTWAYDFSKEVQWNTPLTMGKTSVIYMCANGKNSDGEGSLATLLFKFVILDRTMAPSWLNCSLFTRKLSLEI